MELTERNRLIAVTKGFQGLQGLGNVPLGLLMVANTLELNPDHSAVQFGVCLALFLCAIVVGFAILPYYRRRFGFVRLGGGRHTLLLTVATTAGLFTLFGAMYVDGAFAMHPAASYPVSLTCLWWSAFYLVVFLMPYGLRPHSLWFAALFLGLSFLTMMGVVPKDQFFFGSSHAGNILIWIAFAMHGLLDHLRLLRLLPKASSLNDEATHTAPSEGPHA